MIRSLFLLLTFCTALLCQRIVSLGPAVTNQLLLLEMGDSIVGKTHYCSKEAGKKAEVKVIGNLINQNIESIAILHPDLILASGLTPEVTIEKLKSVGFHVEVIDDPSSFDMLCNNFLTIGSLTGKKEKAKQIVAQAQMELQALPAPPKTPHSVFFELGSKPLFSVTKNTLGDELITLIGGKNIFDLHGSGVVNREEVLLKNPDVIFISEMGEASIQEKKKWHTFQTLNAAKTNNVHIVDAYSIGSPTPISFITTIKEYRKLMPQSTSISYTPEINKEHNVILILSVVLICIIFAGTLLWYGKKSEGFQRHLLLFSSLGVLLIATLYVAASVGGFAITIQEIFNALFKSSDEATLEFFTKLRLPRIVSAFAVGSALAIAGVTMQSLFSNPLVEPYTLGLSASSSLGVALAVILGLQTALGDGILPIAAFLGSLPILLLLLRPALGKKIGEKELLLTGVMFSFVTSSFVMLILSIADIKDSQTIMHWTFGSLNESTLQGGLILIGTTIIILLYLISRAFLLDALALGDEDALAVGIDIVKTRVSMLILVTLLTAFAVSIAGLIGFMGLLIPHMVRLFTGLKHKALLPAAWLTGGIVLIACDTVARTLIAPSELPVGVITGIAGGILFIALSRRRSNA